MVLALSKSDNDTNTRLASTDTAAAISSWGTAINPWILKLRQKTLCLISVQQIVVEQLIQLAK